MVIVDIDLTVTDASECCNAEVVSRTTMIEGYGPGDYYLYCSKCGNILGYDYDD